MQVTVSVIESSMESFEMLPFAKMMTIFLILLGITPTAICTNLAELPRALT